MAAPEASSWGDSIRQYEQAKRVLPFKREDIIPATRISLCERRVLERALDPIKMEFRDSQKEQNYVDMSRTKSEAHINKPQNKMAGTLNLFAGKWPDKKENKSKNKKATVEREWNLVSHFPADIHKKVQITTNFEESQKLMRRPKTTVDNTKSRNKLQREFNVVSNEYFDNNDTRQEKDFDKIKADVEKKYWKTHDFDLIKVQYIDGDKEAKYREQRKTLGDVQGASQFRKLPPSVVYSAGNSYNIINQEVTDELKLSVSSACTERHMNRVKSHEVTDKLSETANMKKELDNERAANRISYQRWKRELDRGYDPIFRNDLTAEHINSVVSVPNQRLRTKNRQEPEYDIGTPGRKLEVPHVHKPEGAWDRIQLDDANNSTALFNATGGSDALRGMAEAFQMREGNHRQQQQQQHMADTHAGQRSAISVRTGTAALSSRPQMNQSPAHAAVGSGGRGGGGGGELVGSGRPPTTGVAHRDLTKPVSAADRGGMSRSASHSNVRQGGGFDSGRLPNNNNDMRGGMVKAPSVPNLSVRSGRGVPALDLTRTETPPAVSYNHDMSGHPGQPVAMIRTGGGGFYAEE
jgi:hypothetical protein